MRSWHTAKKLMAAQAQAEEAAATCRRRRGHPLLRGCKRERYTHGLRPAQMEALRAMCGALIPSLPVPEAEGIRGRGGGGANKDDDLERFYLASAADGTIPDEVAELASRCVWEAVVLVHVVLWILSTKVGTLALCGRLCVSSKFPYVCKFADMPVERREKALMRWNNTRWLFPLKITFAVIKILTHLAFYTMVNENSDNPCWKAMGYSVPDMEQPREDQSEAAPSPRRPLDDGVVETKALNDDATLLRSLTNKGLVVEPDAPSSAYHTVHCDVVIVGSGCGGGVAAAVLAAAGHKVVVVEKGDYFTAQDYTSLEGPSMERLYEQGGIFCTTNVTTILFTGATVGGGSAVNWSASIRTPEDVRQEWAREHGLPVFASPRYAEAMDAVCARLAVTGGCREEGFQNKAVRRGCEVLGLRADAVPRNSPADHFCGSCHIGCPTGEKRGTDTTWLVDAVARGAVVLTGCKAERFVLESSSGGRNARSRKCVGLVARCASDGGVTKKLRIEAKVSIAACGALMTPPLLRNSGLRNRHIGRNLHLHPVTMAWGYFPENKQELTGKCFEGGIITSMHRVTERTIVETPALGPGCFGSMVPWVSGRNMKERMRRYARTAHAFALVRDRGAGTVDGEGRVCYAPASDDVDELRNGLRRALRILVAAGAAEVGTHRSDGLRLRCDGGGVRDEELEAFLDEVSVAPGPMRPGPDKWALHCSAHQMGSCRMGASPGDGAVDGRGESWEAEGLYVCDGSLLPTAVGVNPMITIQSIAYCISKGIAESLAQRKKQARERERSIVPPRAAVVRSDHRRAMATPQQKPAAAATGRRGSPLLWRCKREGYTHGLSPPQMEALRAMCGAIIPSLPVAADELHGDAAHGGRGGSNKDLERFYRASAADGVIPDEVAEMVTRCVWEAMLLLRVILWILSTRVGTLALCGRPAVSGEFPYYYVSKFADMPVERRERALQRWSKARWLFPLKITFTIVKILSHYSFYTLVNENWDNPSWKAIGYSLPADMDRPTRPSPPPRPLDGGVVETRSLNDATLLRSLKDRGLAVKTDVSSGAPQHTVQCDVVIVGSGCGGGVAAAVLAAAGHKVVVVEKGDYFTAEDYSSIEGPSMERMYEKGGIFCTSNVTTIMFAGTTVGGGSAINWSACVRTPEWVAQEWAREHGLPVFGRPEYAHAMDSVCARLAVTGGCREEGFQNKVLRAGCEALGLRADAVARNSSEGHFCGSCNLGCPTGEKRGTDTTWLVDAVARGAVILTGCKAERFVLQSSSGRNARSSKCVGLVARCLGDGGVTKKLRIEAKVSIAAGGALMTPPLLRRSGLKNRHIGRNLHLHPVSMAWGYFPAGSGPEGKCYEGGIITTMHRVSPRTIIQTPSLGPGCLASLLPWESGRDMKERMLRYARTAHAFALVRDGGAGHVDSEARVRYTPSRDDVAELRNGLRQALRVLVAAGAAEVGTHRSDGLRLRCAGLRDEDLEAFLDEVTVPSGPMVPGPDKWAFHCSAHQMGSCRMGASPRDGAVDGRGESWEAEGLYVCDGSVLPTAVGVNPMITIQATAYCVSKGIAESLASGKKQ
ncbi:hypothetical protein U9M48_009451 [Paspalum notatum var. saurae]|uniref:Long-chain-alcohol oxidase n=1 Tax=Paspalum notatum var. saurae TaxID=547442 RepID=A0AAQ3WF07_PASNO